MSLIDLTSKTRDELFALAKEHEQDIGKLAPALGEGKLRDAVEAGLLRRQKRLEREANEAELRERNEKLGAKGRLKGHPSPETVAIEASPKVYCTFLNIENPGSDGALGTDIKFFKGESYVFHLWDQQKHVMPKCLVVGDPEGDKDLVDRMTKYWEGLGMPSAHANKQAINHLRQMAIPNHCVSDRTERRFNPRQDQMTTVIVGKTPRFRFTDIEPAPADAEYGLVIKEIHNGEDTPIESAA